MSFEDLICACCFLPLNARTTQESRKKVESSFQEIYLSTRPLAACPNARSSCTCGFLQSSRSGRTQKPEEPEDPLSGDPPQVYAKRESWENDPGRQRGDSSLVCPRPDLQKSRPVTYRFMPAVVATDDAFVSPQHMDGCREL